MVFALPAAAALAAGTWTWAVTGGVIREFDPADPPAGCGHRGVDIAAAPGTTVLAAADGSVTFAGPVGGRLFLTIDHGGGLESTYSFLEALLVRRGDVVVQGASIARSGTGHAGFFVPHLHFGVRLNDEYQDPLDRLGPIEGWRFIRLAPLAVP